MEQGQATARPRQLPLRVRVLVAILASAFAVLAASEAYRLWSVRDERLELLQEKIRRTADVQAGGLGRAMFDYNDQVVASMIVAIQGDPDIMGAEVVDDLGKQVARFGEAAEAGIGRIIAHRDIAFDNGNGRANVGRLTIAFSTATVDRAVSQQMRLAGFGLLAIVAVLWAAIFASFRRITLPMAAMTAVMLRLAKGDKEVAIPGLGRADEIGDMARAAEVFRRRAIEMERLEAEKATEAAVRESEERLSLIVDAMPVPLMMLDAGDDHVLFANRRMKEEYLGEAVEPDFFADAADRERLREARAQSGEVAAFELGLNRRDGTAAWAVLSITPTIYLGRTVVLAGINDITSRRQAEEKLAQAKDLADKANQLKGEFLANVSHEIRTPMNAVLGMTELCLKTELNAKQRNYLQKAHNSARALLRIINDILDFSKIEAGRLSIEQVEFTLNDVLTHVADVTTVRAQEKGLELLVAVDPQVCKRLVGDPLRLGQVLINLVGNAVKFTATGEVIVSVTSRFEEGGRTGLSVQVRDTGIGMTQEEIGRLFSAFSQADASTTRRFGGTGLGLAISKRIANLMDGDIEVRSQPGEGSVFEFTAVFGTPTSAADHADEANALAGVRVLVVDDNQASRELLSAILESFACTVAASASGEEAISELTRGVAAGEPSYDIVLMDYMMPGMDGVEAARRILDDPRISKPPMLAMVTAYGREEVMQKASQAGLSGFLVKPVSPIILLDTVLGILGREPLRPRPDEADEIAPVPHVAGLRGARILLVEDNEVNQELALEILAQAGMTAEACGNGAEALERLKGNSYDGILMDCQMPVMDGYAASRAIRTNPSLVGLPIIAMTANAMQGDREKCLAAGMNDHVTKPIDIAQLLATMARWIKPAVPAHPCAPEPMRPQPGLDTAAFAGLSRFDVAAGLRRTQGNAALYRRLLQKFLDGNVDFAAQFARALDDADTTAPIRVAHTLKGLAATLGATAVAEAAGVLEHACHDGTASVDLAPLLAGVAAELTPTLAELQALLGVSAPEETAVGPPSVAAITLTPAVTEQLIQLAALLQEGEADAGDLLDEILAVAPELAGAMAPVRRHVAGYDFFAAYDELRKLAEPWSLGL